VQRLAEHKAAAVFARHKNPARLIVLGADTTVFCSGQILGKPVDEVDAARMLRLLSGKVHQVMTGVALVTASAREVAVEVTDVTFSVLSEAQIAAYVASGEPMGKAGAYAIQGRAAKFIPRVEGCYFNVVGLPLARVSGMLDGIR
jgi:septum formation protein